MTREDIIRMAREAGGQQDEVDMYFDYEQLERFAALVAEHERNACAKVCDDMDHNGVMIAADCAAAIRARGEQ